jgi:hypothetical protein
MLRSITNVAVAVFLAGCHAFPTGVDRSSADLPTTAEVESAFVAFVHQQPCPEQAICGRAPPVFVSEAACQGRGPAAARCRFTTLGSYGGPRFACEGLLIRAAGPWTMREMTELCRLVPWPPPSRRTIARLETELRLDEIIQAVGVVDNRSMNERARVRVRAVDCRSLPDGDAMCSYEASVCLPNEQPTTPNGWCARQTRFIHIGGRAFPAVPGSTGWAINRPAAQAD